MGFPHSSVNKESACNEGDLGSIPGSGRCPGEENGNPLQYSCLEDPMDRGAWQATVHGVSRVGYHYTTTICIYTYMKKYHQISKDVCVCRYMPKCTFTYKCIFKGLKIYSTGNMANIYMTLNGA